MIHCSTCLSFHWDSWLSETVKNCFVSHLTPSSLEHHHGFENWCSGQLFILVYCSDYFANNKGSVFSLQWPTRWIKAENIYFNGWNFSGTNFREVADSRKLCDLLSRMVRLIFANDQLGRNLRDKFLQITNFKKYENYFLWKKYFLRSKDVKNRVQTFFFWILRDLYSRTPGFEEFCGTYFRKFAK